MTQVTDQPPYFLTKVCQTVYIYNKLIQVLQLAEHNTEVTEIFHCYQYYII